MAKPKSLYGAPRSSLKSSSSSKTKDISSSTAVSFSSQLSSLLATGNDASRTSNGRSRPSQSRNDIFTRHNKNSKKRALRDLQEDETGSRTKSDGTVVDDATLHRSKRRMEEKARLYAAMKRGDYVPPAGDEKRDMEAMGLVDFDRKWAEKELQNEAQEQSESSQDEENDEEEEMVEYIDEFGRQRTGSRTEAAREERNRRLAATAAEEAEKLKARPSMPTNLIYGDTVQAAAFNPDEPAAAAMEDLARKRDRSLTPPEQKHYDANSEIRSKGVGFYSFSKDAESRRKEMSNLEKERLETERERQEKEDRATKRKRDIEDRKRKIREKRGEKQADRFLEGLNLTKDDKNKPAS